MQLMQYKTCTHQNISEGHLMILNYRVWSFVDVIWKRWREQIHQLGFFSDYWWKTLI